MSQTWVARSELDINLNPGYPSHSGDAQGLGLMTQIRVTDWLWADIGTDVPLRDVYLNRRGYPSGPYKTGPREIDVTFYRPYL